MDSYTFAAALGGAGLAVMAALGVSHLSGGHPNAGPTGGVHTGPTHAAHQHVPTAARGTTRGAGARSVLLSLASPRVLFSVLFGFGVTGLLVRPIASGAVLAAAAVAGGVLLEGVILRPMWNLLFRFASAPAASLEGSLFTEATAASGFDANGQGIVAFEMDGHLVQCLGTLRESDRALGVRVRSGDVLRIEDVDPARSQCVVSYVQRGAR